ncbi:hypothetical protein B0T24DRAFT_222827 [Lasiosphaeria ovina]|uniref:FAD-binding domain-containing protein n=1 Tax=Lasiosphaeria ovina TaxID=92902 RepID=A0AAE0KIQ5_9PEZI|nr:hypothetical protein B0T24DRAFT_222827 [Lasiosphaeria ovina]
MAPQTHFLEGKKIIVAGAGIAGSTFVAALYKLWGPTLSFPEIAVFDRGLREPKREGYSLSLNGENEHGGLIALQQLGVLDDILEHTVFPLNSGRFKMWDSKWNELISLQLKPFGTLPTGTMRIARKDLRRILTEKAEQAKATFHWGFACTAAERLENGRIKVTVASQTGDTSVHECDLLIAADGVHSKIRGSFRPDDKTKYAGAIQMGGQGSFPNGPPSPLEQNWGMMLSGQGVSCFFSAVDKENVVWGLSQREPERNDYYPRAGGLSADQLAALKKEALSLGHMFAEPFRTIVEATDAARAFMVPARDKEPIVHGASLAGLVFIGDANHAVSPFAGNGANLALKDGWDLAEALCQAASLNAAVAAYDKTSLPRAAETLKMSHDRISMVHLTGIKHKLFRAGLATGRLFLSSK